MHFAYKTIYCIWPIKTTNKVIYTQIMFAGLNSRQRLFTILFKYCSHPEGTGNHYA